MSPPANYNTSELRADLETLSQIAENVTNRAEDAATKIAVIDDTMNNLTLSWTGGSADAAQDFNDQLKNALDNIFGIPQEPKTGIIPRIADGLQTAVNNYIAADGMVVSAFSPFSSVANASDDTPKPVINSGDKVGDKAMTAIQETF
jgi:Proteins of 100 residues with WXG